MGYVRGRGVNVKQWMPPIRQEKQQANLCLFVNASHLVHKNNTNLGITSVVEKVNISPDLMQLKFPVILKMIIRIGRYSLLSIGLW